MTYRDRDLNDSTGQITRTGRAGSRLGAFKRLAAVIALTLTLSASLLGLTTTSASAMVSGSATSWVDYCYNTGGNADVTYSWGGYYVSCTYDDGGDNDWIARSRYR